MICEFDLFNLNKPIYEIVRYVKGTSIVADDGIRELYINLKAKSDDKKLSSLFKIMTTVNDIDNKEFPELSKRKEDINNLYIGGERNMNGVLQYVYEGGIKDGIKQGLEQGLEQGKIDILVSQFNNKKISAQEAADRYNRDMLCC